MDISKVLTAAQRASLRQRGPWSSTEAALLDEGEALLEAIQRAHYWLADAGHKTNTGEGCVGCDTYATLDAILSRARGES